MGASLHRKRTDDGEIVMDKVTRAKEAGDTTGMHQLSAVGADEEYPLHVRLLCRLPPPILKTLADVGATEEYRPLSSILQKYYTTIRDLEVPYFIRP